MRNDDDIAEKIRKAKEAIARGEKPEPIDFGCMDFDENDRPNLIPALDLLNAQHGAASRIKLAREQMDELSERIEALYREIIAFRDSPPPDITTEEEFRARGHAMVRAHAALVAQAEQLLELAEMPIDRMWRA